ncbi:MAG TPA: hypothetical protein VE732_04825, partial [Nitrososphaera sp.]|nr:hypothetical protein [Nitrososphaera sp.]
MRDFIINIIAGVALSVATWLLFKIIAPRYRAWLYKSPDLSGTWSTFDSATDEARAVGNATFEQAGEIIKATVIRNVSRKGSPVTRTFVYTGKVRSGQLTLSFEEPVSGGFIAGTLVLKVAGNLKLLSGYTVYLDRDKNEVVTHPIF